MADAAVKLDNNQEFKEVTIKFGKGFVGEPFVAKDGKSYVEIKIPNSDPADKRPWQTFVAPENRVHEDNFGKGMWMKLPENGSTTVKRSVVTGQDENGKNTWTQEFTKVPNKELKGMVEFYKNNDRDRSNEQVAEKATEKTTTKSEKKPSLKNKLNKKANEVAKTKAEKLIEPAKKSQPELPFK